MLGNPAIPLCGPVAFRPHLTVGLALCKRFVQDYYYIAKYNPAGDCFIFVLKTCGWGHSP